MTGPTNALVGEGRYKEAVIPLRPDVLAEIGAGIGRSSGGNTTFQVTTMDPLLAANAVYQRLGGALAT